MASTTRQLLSAALKDQLRTTPLDKVTVSGLTAQAGITRQTFYYHYADVYDLAVWVFEQEVANHIMEHASYSEWAKGYRTLLQYLQDNFEQAKAVLNSLGHRERDAFFLEQFRNMMEAIVTELEGDLVLTPEDRQFVVDHYAATVGYRTLSVSGLGLNYRFQVLWCRSSQLMAVPHLTGPCWRWCWRASW